VEEVLRIRLAVDLEREVRCNLDPGIDVRVVGSYIEHRIDLEAALAGHKVDSVEVLVGQTVDLAEVLAGRRAEEVADLVVGRMAVLVGGNLSLVGYREVAGDVVGLDREANSALSRGIGRAD
jgi:hypothetical protein